MSENWKEWSNHVLAELKRFDKSFDSLGCKIDRIEDKLGDQNETLARNTVTLEDHVRRTNLLESRLQLIEKDLVELDASLKETAVLAHKIEESEKNIEVLEQKVSKLAVFVNRFRLTPKKLKYLTLVFGLASAVATLYFTFRPPR